MKYEEQLEELIILLTKSSDDHWVKYFTEALYLYNSGEENKSYKKVLGAFGGMSSFNDIGFNFISNEEVFKLIKDTSKKNIRNIDDVDRTIADFMDASNRKRPLGKRIASFIAGQSKVGSIVGSIVDFATIFLPYRSQINKVRRVIKRKVSPKTMLQNKKWYQSKTIWSAILLILTAILQAVGVDLAGNPEVMATVYEVVYVLAGAFGLYGLRDAIDQQRNED